MLCIRGKRCLHRAVAADGDDDDDDDDDDDNDIIHRASKKLNTKFLL